MRNKQGANALLALATMGCPDTRSRDLINNCKPLLHTHTHTHAHTHTRTVTSVNRRFAASHTLSLRYVFLALFNTRARLYTRAFLPPARPPSRPQLLSVCDYIWLGRALPNARSWGCLLLLLAGSVGYVLVDADFRLSAYTWLALW